MQPSSRVEDGIPERAWQKTGPCVVVALQGSVDKTNCQIRACAFQKLRPGPQTKPFVFTTHFYGLSLRVSIVSPAWEKLSDSHCLISLSLSPVGRVERLVLAELYISTAAESFLHPSARLSTGGHTLYLWSDFRVD